MISWPIFQPQDSASDLASHPHRVTLLEGSGRPNFPELCPNCGKAAFGRIVVQKVFRHTAAGDSVTTYVIQQAEVPYCDNCAAQHHREQQLLTRPQRVVVSLADGLTVSALGSGFMALVFLPAALRSVAQPGFPLLLVVVAFFVLIACSSFSGAWEQNTYRRIPPQTSITLAFDFGESYSQLFKAARRSYAIRNAAFAQAFIKLNQQFVQN